MDRQRIEVKERIRGRNLDSVCMVGYTKKYKTGEEGLLRKGETDTCIR